MNVHESKCENCAVECYNVRVTAIQEKGKQVMKKITGRVVSELAAAMMLLLAGCSEKSCYFVTKDSQDLQVGAKVVWYDAYVGKVDSIESDDGGYKVSVKFSKKFNDQIHDGVAGRIVNDPKISSRAFVLLVGGRDKNRPPIEGGVEIPESKPGNAVQEGFSAFVDWLKNSRTDELKVVGVGLLILFTLLKFVSKKFKFILFLGILGAIGYVCVTANIDWSNYKERLTNVKETANEAKEWVQKHGEKLHVILETALEADE